MSRELLQNHPSITNYTTIWMDSLRDGKSELVNTNKLIRTYDGITGLKTGSTSLALYNLSASATREDLSLIAVVMRAPTAKDRFQDAKLLLDYGFNTYTFQKIATKDSVVQNVNINKGVQNSVNLVFENDSGVLLKKSNSSEIKQELSINENIEAPISKGTTLGSMNYYIDDNLISSVNLVAETDVSKKTLLNTFNYICTNWLNLLRT
jgi:D-alanyl-D-alanine carboxypeptidase (penicillin-binding protein 5/6)